MREHWACRGISASAAVPGPGIAARPAAWGWLHRTPGPRVGPAASEGLKPYLGTTTSKNEKKWAMSGHCLCNCTASLLVWAGSLASFAKESLSCLRGPVTMLLPPCRTPREAQWLLRADVKLECPTCLRVSVDLPWILSFLPALCLLHFSCGWASP